MTDYNAKLKAKALKQLAKDSKKPGKKRHRPGRAEWPGVGPGVVMALKDKPGDLKNGDHDPYLKTEAGIIAALDEIDHRIDVLQSAKEEFETAKAAHLRKKKAGEVPPFIPKRNRPDPDTAWRWQGELNSLLRRRKVLNDELKSLMDTRDIDRSNKPYSGKLTHLMRAEKRLSDLINELPQRFAGSDYSETASRLKDHLAALQTKIRVLSVTHQPDTDVEVELRENLMTRWNEFKSSQ